MADIKVEKANRFKELIEIVGLGDNNNNILYFNYQPNKLLETKLTLRNNSKNKIIYKFKTTNPKMYSVQPNQKEIHPNSEVTIEFTMQPRQDFKEQVGDRFLIDVAELTEQILQQEEDLGKILKQYVAGTIKLEVGLRQQQNLRESTDASMKQSIDLSSYNNTSQRDTSVLGSSKLYTSMQGQPNNEEEKRLNEALAKTKNENSMLLKQNQELEKKIKNLQKVQSSNNQEANFTMFHVIAIAIIALIAGAFLTK